MVLTSLFYNNVPSISAQTTLKVDLRIINLEGDTYNENREFWVDTPIGAAADISVSGKGAKLVEPWVVLTVPKSQYLAQKPTFVDSQNAYETLKEETADYYIITYKFKEISGGSRFTFPFPFKFKWETPNQTQLPVNFKIVDGSKEDKPVLYNYDTAYIAKRQEFKRLVAVSMLHNPRTNGSYSAFDASKNIPNPHQDIKTKLDTDLYTDTLVVHAGQTTTGSTPLEYQFFPGVKISYPAGTTGTISYVPVEKLVVKYTLPEGVTPAARTLAGDKNFKAEWDPITRVLTQIDTNPDRYVQENWGPFNHFTARTAGVALNFTDIPFDVEKKIKVEITQKNKGEEEFSYQPLSHSIVFKARKFTSSYNLEIYKDNYSGWARLYLDESKAPYIYEGTYTYVKPGPAGRFYADSTDMTEQGMNYFVHLANTNNNASNPDKTAKPLTTSIFKITDILEKDGTTRMAYRSIKFSNIFNSDVIKKQFNERSKVLYGVLANGVREEIKRDFKTGDIVEINDKAGKYRELEIEFAQPIILNNTNIRYDIATELLADEWKKFEDGTHTERQIYQGSVKVEATTAVESETKEHEKKSYPDRYNGRFATTSMWKLAPKSSLRVENNNPTIPFSASGSKFTLKYDVDTNHRGFGPTSFEDLKLIVLLPTGYEYNGNLRLQGVVQKENPDLKPEMIENYKNTGKTALVFPLPNLTPSEQGKHYNAITFDGLITKNANRGNSVVEAYLTYANNDVITPPGNQVYKDTYDLDNDGNRDENFIFANTTINYIPPLELSSKKLVGYSDVDLKLLATGDLGYQFVYELSIFNNTIDVVRNAHLIDTLPYVGDHTITANQDGVYLPRESKFSTPLVRALEDEPKNADLLERFDFFYQLEDAGATLESVRDGNWVTKDAVTDFSKVKSIKISLKAGKEIKSKEEVKFYMSASIPFNKLLEVGTYSVNSVAVSTDGHIYAEANKVQTTFAKYAVDGIVFKDYNKDNQFSTNESKIAGQVVELIDVATGKVALDSEGNPIVGKTDSEGKYHFDVYRRGEYQVRFKEIADAPFTGYNKSKIGNHVEQTLDGYGYTKKFELNPTITSVNMNAGYAVEKRDLVITKVSSTLNPDGSKKGLEDAKFELRNQNNDQVLATEKSDANGKVIFKDVMFGNYKVVEIQAPKGYVLDSTARDVEVSPTALAQLEITNDPIKGKVKVIKVDAEDSGKKLDGVVFELKQGNKVIAEGTTANGGVFTFNDVVYGDYQLVEKTTLENYNLDTTPVEVQVREQGKEVEKVVKNQVKKGSVKVTKVDAEDATKVLKGVSFALKQNGVTKYTAETNEDGIALFKDVVYGEYQLVETATLENYNLNPTPVTVEVKAAGVEVAKTVKNQIKKGSIKVIKVDAEDATKKLDGVVFELKQGNKVIAEGTTVNGEYVFNDVVYGDYQLVEKTTLENYNLDTTPVEVQVREQGKEVEKVVKNQIKKGSIKVIKVDAEDATKKLDGVVFELKQGNKVIAEGTTANGGVFTFNDVVYGDYQLVEKTTLENYNLNTTPVEVQVREQGKEVEKVVKNQIKKGNVKVTKVDSENHTKVLPGVVFELHQNGVMKYSATTDANGVALFENVVYGGYELVEAKGIESYNLSSERIGVMVIEDGATVDLGNYQNTKIYGSIVLQKIDAESKQGLAGVEFTLRKGDGSEVVAVSDANGMVRFERLAYGSYEVKESKALSGYVLNESASYGAIIRNDGEVVDLGIVENKSIYGSVVLQKVDAESKQPLAGVEFSLYQMDAVTKEKVVVATQVSDANGMVRFNKVKYGAYIVEESKALAGYNKVEESYGVLILEDGAVFDLGVVTNKAIKGSVHIHKIDGTTKANLAGVEFTIYKEGKAIASGVTNERGEYTFKSIGYGNYTIKETKGLAGYVVNEKEYEVSIQTEGEVVSIEVENYRVLKPAIDTGDSTIHYGFIMFLSLIGFFLFSRRKLD